MVSGIGVVAGQHDDRRLESVLAQDAHRLPPVDVGQPDVHDDQVDMTVLGGLQALGCGVDGPRLEFLVQRELLHQRGAQFGVIVDDEDFAGIRHDLSPGEKPAFSRSRAFGTKRASGAAKIGGDWQLEAAPGRQGPARRAEGAARARGCRQPNARLAHRRPPFGFRSRLGAAASKPTSARATAPPRPGGFASRDCGGAPIAGRGRGPCSPSAASAPKTPGAKTRPTGATTGTSASRPAPRATVLRATIISMISSSSLTTIRARGSPAAEAPCSSMLRG